MWSWRKDRIDLDTQLATLSCLRSILILSHTAGDYWWVSSSFWWHEPIRFLPQTPVVNREQLSLYGRRSWAWSSESGVYFGSGSHGFLWTIYKENAEIWSPDPDHILSLPPNLPAEQSQVLGCGDETQMHDGRGSCETLDSRSSVLFQAWVPTKIQTWIGKWLANLYWFVARLHANGGWGRHRVTVM